MSDSTDHPSGHELEPLGQPAPGGTTSPRMLVPLFLVPLLIVALIVGIFLGVGALIGTEKSVAQWIGEVETGGVNERWQAAANLSEIALRDPGRLAVPEVRTRLRTLFTVAGPDDTRLRQWIAEMWTQIGDAEAIPLCLEGIEQTLKVLKAPESAQDLQREPAAKELLNYVRALGVIGNSPTFQALLPLAKEPDLSLRMAVAEAAGTIARKTIVSGGQADPMLIETLVLLHGDADVWVRMNAALALAKCGRREGLPTLETMLDRAWLKQQNLTFPDDGKYSVNSFDPAAQPIASALLAIDALVLLGQLDATNASLREAITKAATDPNPVLQQRANALLTKLDS